MKAKKNPKYDLEKRRKLYFNLGLLVAGSVTLAAFRWGTPVEFKNEREEVSRTIPTEILEIQTKIQPKKLEQSSPKPPTIIDPEKIKEVDKVEPIKDLVTPDIELPPFKFEGPVGQGDLDVDKGDPLPFEPEDVENMPEFPGGDAAMALFIQKNYKLPRLTDLTDQGTIYVRFVVSANGEIADISIARGINKELDNEAIRVVQAMPHWTPGKYRGRNVGVRMVIPIKIRYQ
jgi:protein TonB